MWRQIDFTMAVSGAVVGYPLEVVDGEFRLDTEVLSVIFNRHLCHFLVVSDTTCSPLSGFIIEAGKEDIELQLVDPGVDLAKYLCKQSVNMLDTEFIHFAAEMPLEIPQMYMVEQSYPPRFYNVTIRSLAPFIFQDIVKDARHWYVVACHQRHRYHLLPTGDRAAKHIVQMIFDKTQQNAPLMLVKEFIREFTRENQSVIDLIDRKLEKKTFCHFIR